MARAGLGPAWKCIFANDFDNKKGRIYDANWGKGTLVTRDVRELDPADLPGRPALVWGSFPCQDLSLAGGGAGLRGERSGTFWPFWRLVCALNAEGRGPDQIVLENVCGTLTSHKGRDFAAICNALREGGYRYGAIVVDAALFVPQSRPRLFILAVKENSYIDPILTSDTPHTNWHTRMLIRAHDQLDSEIKMNWIWWTLPSPQEKTLKLLDIIEQHPESVDWHSDEETAKLIAMMSDHNRRKIETARISGLITVGTLYRRTRSNSSGAKQQRAEVRFDDIAGCLRTPSGGSSRQFVIFIHGSKVRSRLISSRETARLMGLPDDYILPDNYNEAYHLTGDGVVVPVVNHISTHLLMPIFRINFRRREAA